MLSDLERFFRGPVSERSIWEAKQNDAKTKLMGFIRKEVCGFANRRGGYLVLGAAEPKKNKGWDLAGIEVSGVRELHDWVASLLRKLDPLPFFDTHEWSIRGTSRRVLVIQVEPAAFKPVSFDGTVYLRHGTQTIKASGAQIRRLAEEGSRAEHRIEKPARKKAKEFAEQVFTPLGLVVARDGSRPYPLSDPRPTEVIRSELKRTLKKRWPKRSFEKVAWPSEEPKDLDDLAIARHPAQRDFLGWRGGWIVNQGVPKVLRDRPRRVRGLRTNPPKIDRRLGDRDIWLTALYPHNMAGGGLFQLPVRQRSIEQEYGHRAIGNAALLLEAIIRMELELGAEPFERIFTCVVIKGWSQPGTMIERWEHLSVKPREWRKHVTEEAGRSMHLTQPRSAPPGR